MTTSPTPEYSPLRASLFTRWLTVWHVLYISGLLVALGVALWGTRDAWAWRDAALIAIVIVLIVAYLRVIVYAPRWPQPMWLMLAYYLLVIGLLALAVWINPIFIWAEGMLIGQMFGVLPPVLAMPGVVSIVLLIVFQAGGWQLPDDLTWSQGLIITIQIGGLLLLYLYIYHIIRTSQERAQLVNELRAAKEQLERARETETELATLRERERVARDLHDGLGHSLVTLSVQLEAVQRLYSVDPVRASAQIDEMKRLTRDSMTQLRRTLDGLRSSQPLDEPLTVALQHLCVGLSNRTGMVVTCDAAPESNALRPTAAEALWRVTQEALANAERHSDASTVTVRLAAIPDPSGNPAAVSLTIDDNGKGVPPAADTFPGHYGLRGMRERIEGLGGSLRIENHQGTRITAELPLVYLTSTNR